MTFSATQREAYDAGYDANEQGILRSQNPYAEGSEQFAYWDAGFSEFQIIRDAWEDRPFYC